MFGLILLAAVSAQPGPLRCFSGRDRIDIHIPAGVDKRIGSLAVVHGGNWVTLVDEDHHFVAFRPGVRRLVLVPSRQMGAYRRDDGTERRVKAFAERGTYRIVFADNLETEPENMIEVSCLVRLK